MLCGAEQMFFFQKKASKRGRREIQMARGLEWGLYIQTVFSATGLRLPGTSGIVCQAM